MAELNEKEKVRKKIWREKKERERGGGRDGEWGRESKGGREREERGEADIFKYDLGRID
jgi:hypothetical protein